MPADATPGPVDIADWLAALDLGQYAAVFAAQDIDASLLPRLTAQDLREIGIRSVGRRRRILSAAASLALPDPTHFRTGERRVVTVMFCDLVESPRLAARLDPEDYRELLARYRQVLEAAARPYDGELVQFVGDGALLFFGHHRLREHDAESAVAAGLEIVKRVRAMAPFSGGRIRLRIGIATGLTVVGGETSDRPMIGDHAVGKASNLAARLQARAAPDTILLAASSQARIGALFACEDLGPLALKGFETGMRAWRVLGHNAETSRFEALRTGGQSALLIGRDRELALLARQFTATRAGQGRISLLIGEGGHGKSRLVRDALAAEARQAAVPPILQCAPYHVATPFQPIRYYLGTRLAAHGARAADAPRDGLAMILADLGLCQRRDLDLGLELMRGFHPGDGLFERATCDPRADMLGFLARLLAAIARESGAIVIEDAHWIDPSTAELVANMSRAEPPVTAHLIVTMRPGPFPVWLPEDQVRRLPLDRLGAADLPALVHAVAREVAPDLCLSDAMTKAIAARSDGSPVFIEELTRASIEGMTEGRDLDSLLAELPATLTDSLVARLDRLTVGRSLALVAAVIGSEFPVAVLRAVADLPDRAVEDGISELLRSGVLRTGHSNFGPALSFRHRLLRDAAYDILLRRDRVALHARVARILRTNFPRLAESLPHIVALNLFEAGDFPAAAQEWKRAGALASARSAYREAVTHFTRAIEACGRADPPGSQAACELDCRLELMSALIADRGFDGLGVAEEQARIAELGRETGDEARLMPMLHARWMVLGGAGKITAALELARRFGPIACAGSEIDRLVAHRVLGTSLLFSGRLAAARAELDRFFDNYDPARHAAALHAVGTSGPALMCMIGMAEILVLSEDFAGADAWRDRARSLAEAGGRGHDLCNVTLFVDCLLPALQGRHAAVAEGAARLRRHATAYDLDRWTGFADLFAGSAAIHLGDPDRGLASARDGALALRDRLGFLRFCFIHLVEACLRLDRHREAAAALTIAGGSWEETWVSAELQRLRAGILRAEGAPWSEIRACLDAAHALAAQQGADLFARRIRRDIDRFSPAASSQEPRR